MTLMGKEQELRPCPLCHRNVEAVQDDHDHKANGPWYIECLCGIEMHDSSLARLVTRWNRRSSSDEAEVGLTIAGVTIPLTEPSPSGVKAGVTEALTYALRENFCPRPCNGRPADLTVGACVDFGECGCMNGPALRKEAPDAHR